MSQVLVRDIDADVLARLKARAEQHGRSLQAELKQVLEEASRARRAEAVRLAANIRRRLQGRAHGDSARLQRQDRRR